MIARLMRIQDATWITIAAGISLAAWVAAAIVMSGRGLDVTDEGFYLLSYRWWDTNPYTFTGAQYIFGPVYEWLGYDAQSLRLARVVLIVISHCVLGVGGAAWIRDTARGPVDRQVAWVVPGSLAACGGLVLAWGPLTPSYNDLSLVATLFLAAAALSLHRSATLGRRLPTPSAICLGPVLVAFAVSKWSSALITVVLVVALTGLAMRHSAPKKPGQWLVLLGLSTVTTLGLVHVLARPWPAIVTPMLNVTGELTRANKSPGALLNTYLTSTLTLGSVVAIPLGIAVALTLVVRTASPGVARSFYAVLPVGAMMFTILLVGGVEGGVAGVRDQVAVLVVGIACTWWVHVRQIQGGVESAPGTRLMLVLLALLPAAQAFGTDNPLYFLAVKGFAFWLFLVLWLWARSPTGSVVRTSAGLATVALLTVVAWVTVNGILVHPYRTLPFSANTTPISAESIGTLRVGPETVQTIDALRSAVTNGQSSLPIMAFDEMAGNVLLLDGRPVGEAWYPSDNPTRTLNGIKAFCDDHPAAWRAGGPVVLLNRPMSRWEIDTLEFCGLHFWADFTRVEVPSGPPGLVAYVRKPSHS